ncbi:MAG TPA: hypothetical protein EYH12_04025 [Psychromonas hadalis]|nr:hypothetical protein [Psychromonas hadalis]
MSISAKPQQKSDAQSLIQELKLGWEEFISKKWVWVSVLQFAFVIAGMDAFIGLIGPSLSKEVLSGASYWGFIAGALGLGTLIPGVVSFKLNPKYPMRTATFCVLFLALMPLSMPFSTSLYLMIAAPIVAGIGIEIFSVIWISMLQFKIPPEMLSRVSAYDHIGSVSLAPLGLILAGFLY